MNIALLSNSIINRTLSFHTGYVFDIQVDNIYLPTENHSSDELFSSDRKCLHIVDSIEEIIDKSDIIIATNSKIQCDVPKSKRIISVDNPWDEKNFEQMNRNFPTPPNNKLVIVIMSLGRFCDQYCTEILIHKILSNSEAKFHQTFSPETQSILRNLSSHGLLRHSLVNSRNEEADIFVFSIDGTQFHNDAEYVCELRNLSPDLLFICTDRSIDNFNDIAMVSKIACNTCMFIHSPYISYDVGTGVKYPVYYGPLSGESNINSLDWNLESVLKKEIMARLYFPSGTVIF